MKEEEGREGREKRGEELSRQTTAGQEEPGGGPASVRYKIYSYFLL